MNILIRRIFVSEFKRFIQNGLVYYKAENLEKQGFLEHIYTTRLGGVSLGECESLNLGINKNDKKEKFLAAAYSEVFYKNFEYSAPEKAVRLINDASEISQ
jgi:hypothetical protein